MHVQPGLDSAATKQTLAFRLARQDVSVPSQRAPLRCQASDAASGFPGVPLNRVSLAQVRDPSNYHVELRPALIDTAGSDFGAQIPAFQRRTTPEALLQSPLREDGVTAVHGREADGTPYVGQRATLAARLEPYLANRAAYGPAGAYSFTPIMVNKDRPQIREFTGIFPPAAPWDAYFLGAEPDAFPVDLLGAPCPGTAGAGVGSGPKINTSLILGVGLGEGQAFHWHGANVFVQVHGEKKWSLFPNADLYRFFEPGARYERRQPCPFSPQYAPLFEKLWWDGPSDMPRPTEFITRPGDALYMPTGTWHATWNLTDYTFGYTKVVDF